MYTKEPKTICQVIKETMSWMEEEGLLEMQQSKQEEKWRDDNDRPKNWDMMTDEDPTDMLYSI